MVLKSGSAAKLASLSAFGVGTLVVGAKDAKATVIFSGPLNNIVGFDSQLGTPSTSFTSANLGAGSAHFKFSTSVTHPGPTVTHRKVLYNGVSLLFRAGSSGPAQLRIFSSNAANTFSKSAPFVHAANHGFAASVNGNLASGFPNSNPNGTNNGFALFSFTSGIKTLYGWLDLELFTNQNHLANSNFGPDVKIISFAYDDSGAKLGAGQQSSAAPEPSTLALTGLAALALGAAGTRRWRAARKAA